MSAPVLPDLEFRPPDCPLCGQETNSVDGCFDCESCNLSWDKRGEHGERMDPQLPQCTAECSRYDETLPSGELRWPPLVGQRYRCVLDADHTEHCPHRGVRVDKPSLVFDTYTWPVEAIPA